MLKSIATPSRLIAVLLAAAQVLTALPFTAPAFAEPPTPVGGQPVRAKTPGKTPGHIHQIVPVRTTPLSIPSKPLADVQVAERAPGFRPLRWPPVSAGPAGREAVQPEGAGDCTSPTIDLKLLIIAASPTDTSTTLPAIQQTLDYLGVPYTVFTATPRPGYGGAPGDDTTDRLQSLLATGCHAHYQGVILGNGQVVYDSGPTGFVSALTPQEWVTLGSYQATFAARLASWYTFPSPTYGFENFTGGAGPAPTTTQLTTAGQAAFGYMNPTATPVIDGAWTYFAKALTASTTPALPPGASVQPLLVDGSGNALVNVYRTADGRESVAMTFEAPFF